MKKVKIYKKSEQLCFLIFFINYSKKISLLRDIIDIAVYRVEKKSRRKPGGVYGI